MAEDYTTARLVTLTDGVLSIAMTLLVLDIRLPGSAEGLGNQELWQQLIAIWPQIFSYGLSFLVIAVLWINHVQKFRHLARTTAIMIWLNILFLLGVGVVPFTTALLAENGNGVSTAVYAVGMALASLMLALMSVHVRVSGLTEEGIGPEPMRNVSILTFGTAIVFFASAGIAFVSSDCAKYCWLLLVPLQFLRAREGHGAAGGPSRAQ